ncbi:C4-dicarboxylate ABC transporter permease [Synergistales bacterium]|nr:C4-dicarboxylate ABC transporter permease [Synergistales bacterium]
MSIGAVLFITFFAALAFNVPIAFSLFLSSIVAMFMTSTPFEMIATSLFAAVSKFTLLAVPFFILAGMVMEKAGVSKRLIHFANTCVGHIRGGLAIVMVITACFFAAISGSGPATVAALGVILIPAMVKSGYDKGMAAALMATCGGIGLIIPPSISYVLYGVVAEQSIGKLFMAGVIPGLVVGACLIVASSIVSHKHNYGLKTAKATGKERWEAFKDAFWGLLTPVIILGGIYGGVFTPTEAAAVAAFYGMFVGFFVYKELTIAKLKDLLIHTSLTTGMVLLIIGGATAFAWMVTTEGVALQFSEAMLQTSRNPIAVLAVINVIFLIAGCFLDGISITYIFVPLLVPVLQELNIDLVHFGIILTVNVAIGQITPPVGMNLFVACPIAGLSLMEISKSILPFLLASIVALLLITYIPGLSLWLPRLLGM